MLGTQQYLAVLTCVACLQTSFSPGCGGCFTYNIPGGLTYHKALNKTYKNEQDGYLMAWRAAHWANVGVL